MGKEEAMAEKRAYRGSMTVFFSVLTVLFLALISAMAESVRVQGARAKAASVLDLGIFSVLGEYERDLLEEYEVFGVDASYGGEDFQKEKLSERLDFFMKYNIEPTRGTMLTGNTLFRGRLGLPGPDCAEFKERRRDRAGSRVSGSPEKVPGDGEKPEGLRKAGAGSRESAY